MSLVSLTAYEGILNTIAAARFQDFCGRFVYMTSIGVTRRSLFASALNVVLALTLGKDQVQRAQANSQISSLHVGYPASGRL